MAQWKGLTTIAEVAEAEPALPRISPRSVSPGQAREVKPATPDTQDFAWRCHRRGRRRPVRDRRGASTDSREGRFAHI